jgi:hypothetical protein
MKLRRVRVSKTACKVNASIEEAVNRLVRGYDRVARPLGVGVRTSNYDDLSFAFEGGHGERLRKVHYDKSLRLLWKAQQHAPHTGFRDCTSDEAAVMQLAEGALDKAEKHQLARMKTADYRKFLARHYTKRQRQAIVNILSTIAHGEAYAWLVSADLLAEVRSTGGRSAMTMQVLEEAKHFVVLRELLQSFDCEIPRMNAWEYITLENVLRQSGLEKFFGMNVLVEGLALSIFGTMSSFPGLEVLRMFHLDESRHTALPHNYFHDFPLSSWQKYNPVSMARRVALLLPAVPFLLRMEEDFAVLGIDVLEFGGSVLRKVLHLSDRVGFWLVFPESMLLTQINLALNAYAALTRKNHRYKDYMSAEATVDDEALAVERGVFQLVDGGEKEGVGGGKRVAKPGGRRGANGVSPVAPTDLVSSTAAAVT